MHIFVTGGSGFVGGHLVERLVADGHQVSALARSDASAALVTGYGAVAVRGDVRALPEGALHGVDAVVHCAARAEDWGPRAWFEGVNVRGTEAILAAARAAGVRRFVHVGTEAALFVGRDLVGVDEGAPLPDRHPYAYGATKAEAERLVLAADGPGMRTVSIRPRFVWGPRDTSVLPALIDTVEQGGFWWLDGGRHLTSTCHVDNLVEALVLALHHGEGGRAWFVTDGEDRSLREVLTRLAATRGVTLPDRSLPGVLGRTAGVAAERLWAWLRPETRPPMTAMATAMLSRTVTVRDAAARRDLGYRPVMGWEEGLAALAG